MSDEDTTSTERHGSDPEQIHMDSGSFQPTQGWHIDIPHVGPVGWPLTGSLSYLITVSALAAFEVIPWPVAGLLGLGHIMARNRDNRVVSEIGSGLKVVG